MSEVPGPLQSVERNGVVIDRCTQCGGIFIERGELERLIAAERAYLRPGDEHRFERGRDRHDDDDDDDWDDDYRRKRKKERRGFLEELLDF